MNFEKMGAFYLGKQFDLEKGQLLQRLLMYDSKDLTTHALCVGMTGSGKTGLCISLLEEAAIDKVPAIIIDPKGDITNLLLTFPNLDPSEFKPWVNADEAQRKGLTLDELAKKKADLWRNGLSDWGEDAARIRMLKESADFAIYTPGSEAGLPVSILHSFKAPAADWDTQGEMLRERIQGMVSALLGLVGIEADPLRSREAILLSSLIEHFWRKGEGLDLAKLILSIESPPIQRLGVFEVDTFFPRKERFEMAMSLNNIIASPAFQSWMTGQPLDIASFLSTTSGQPRHSIFYIAHLNDGERMFFVTMLLNQLLGWMRSQPGTTSLRALLYMDEIFGFLPPVANPPSKRPLLTLLKQARAFGVGTMLATQNPVDLDYKGLTNCGTWFIGRLQTERDKNRVLDGLASASQERGRGLDKKALSQSISKLGKRVFLMHNVHEEEPVIFHTRWAMSYLRGPLTRSQIRKLKGDRGHEAAAAGSSPLSATLGAKAAEARMGTTDLASTPPTLHPDIAQIFVPIRRAFQAARMDVEGPSGEGKADPTLVYYPWLLGTGRVHFVNRAKKVDEVRDFAYLAEAPERASNLRWDEASSVEVEFRDLEDRPDPEALFESVPDTVNEAREFKGFSKELSDHLYRSSTLKLMYNPKLKIYSRPGESETEFHLRLNQAAREERDEEIEKLKRRYERKLRRLEDRLAKAELAMEKKQATADARKRETFVAVGESILGIFLGRRAGRAASSGLSKYRMSSTAKMAAREAEEKMESLQREIAAMEQELQTQTETIQERWEQSCEELQEVGINARRADIEIEFFGLAWVPFWRFDLQDASGRVRSRVVDAFQPGPGQA